MRPTSPPIPPTSSATTTSHEWPPQLAFLCLALLACAACTTPSTPDSPAEDSLTHTVIAPVEVRWQPWPEGTTLLVEVHQLTQESDSLLPESEEQFGGEQRLAYLLEIGATSSFDLLPLAATLEVVEEMSTQQDQMSESPLRGERYQIVRQETEPMEMAPAMHQPFEIRREGSGTWLEPTSSPHALLGMRWRGYLDQSFQEYVSQTVWYRGQARPLPDAAMSTFLKSIHDLLATPLEETDIQITYQGSHRDAQGEEVMGFTLEGELQWSERLSGFELLYRGPCRFEVELRRADAQLLGVTMQWSYELLTIGESTHHGEMNFRQSWTRQPR